MKYYINKTKITGTWIQASWTEQPSSLHNVPHCFLNIKTKKVQLIHVAYTTPEITRRSFKTLLVLTVKSCSLRHCRHTDEEYDMIRDAILTCNRKLTWVIPPLFAPHRRSNSHHVGKRYVLGRNRESRSRPRNCDSRPGNAISWELTSLGFEPGMKEWTVIEY